MIVRIALLALLSSACTEVASSFQCAVGGTQCGSNGTCESTGYCSFTAMGCPAPGRKYDRSAGGGLADTCVGETSDAGTPASLCPSFLSSGGFACLSFESAVDTPWGIYTMQNGAVTPDTTHVARGSFSGHIQFPALTKGQQPGAAQINIPSVPSNSAVYVRAYYWIDTPPPIPQPLIGLQQNATPFKLHQLTIQPNGDLQIGDDIIGTTSTSYPFTFKQWVCLTFTLQIAASGLISASIADKVVLSISGNTVASPVTDVLALGPYGAATSAATPAWEAWVDEIAVSTSAPILCKD